MKVSICVISAGRSSNVSKVQEQFPYCHWYVPSTQKLEYESRGAKCVVGVEGELPMKGLQLNAALESQFGLGFDVVVTVDDDILKVVDKFTKTNLSPNKVAHKIAEYLVDSSYYLGGPYNGGNVSWASGKIEFKGLISGAMMVHKKGSGLLFDTESIMEDIDLSINHHVTHHGVVKCGMFCLENEWGDNKGGYQTVRSNEKIRRALEKIVSKWNSYGVKMVTTKPMLKPVGSDIGIRIPWKQLTKLMTTTSQ